MEETPTPVDDFLQVDFSGPADPTLRQALLTRTTRVVRRRLWARRAGIAGALAACYAAGMLTMGFVTPPREGPQQEVARQPSQRETMDTPVVAAADSVAEQSALALEWRAFESAERRAELYQLAGDRYLEREADMQSALRCYRQALDASPEASLTISASDNWLLMALKEARQKEKTHARNGS